MKLATLAGRAVIVRDDAAFDIAEASDGQFSSELREVFEHWDAFRTWADSASLEGGRSFTDDELEAPVRWPRQVFAIGLNYKDHADEASLPYPEHLIVFTKFASSIATPNAVVALPSDQVDYETELVVVVGRGGHRIPVAEAWDAVAGLAIGQDYSEREVQRRGPAAQFSLGKSYPNFTPYGPVVVTPDEFENRDALRISAVLSGEGLDEPIKVQDGTTADLIFSVAQTVSDLSQVVTLMPGDLILTGTPAGVGLSRGLLLKPGQVLTSTLEGVGSIRNEFVAG